MRIFEIIAVSFIVCSSAPAFGNSLFNAQSSGLDIHSPEALLQERIKKIGVENLLLTDGGKQKLNPELVNLGKELFFSKSLSGELDVACASCHHPFLAGGDALSLPVGVGAYVPNLLGPGRWHDWNSSPESRADGSANVARNSPTTINSRFYKNALFHDGRVFLMPNDRSVASDLGYYRTPDSNLGRFDPLAGSTLLQAQTRFPIVSAEEMRGYVFGEDSDNDAIREALVARLRGDSDELENNGWPELFQSVFDDLPQDNSELISFKRIQQAISAYQQSQVAIDNPWQRYLKGSSSALSATAKFGAWLFLTPASGGGAGCAGCHTPPFFTDESYHNIAIPQFGRGKNADSSDYGRYQVTRNTKDRFRFRTPSVFNVEMTGPYGHTGAFATLREVVEHHVDPQASIAKYDYGFAKNPQLKPAAHLYRHAQKLSEEVLESLLRAQAAGESALQTGLSLESDQLDAVVSFLESLTDPCLKNKQCLATWIPSSDTPAPDDNRLIAEFSPSTGMIMPPLPFRSSAVADSIPDDPTQLVGKTQSGADSRKRQRISARLIERDMCKPSKAMPVAKNPLPQFSEVAQRTGLTRGHHIPWDFYSIRTAQRLLFTGGVAAADVNGDCLIDIFLPTGNSDTGILYLNTDEGFVDASKQWGLDLVDVGQTKAITNGAAFADLEGDGDLDLLISLVSSDHSSSVKNSAGTRTGNASKAIILLNEGESFRPLTNSGIKAHLTAWSFGLADVDADGDLDVMTTHWRGPGLGGPHPNHLWRNQLKGAELRFAAADDVLGLNTLTGQTDFTFTPTFSDVSADGLPDLLLAADFASSQYFRNAGHGFLRATHRSEINDENGMGNAVGDYDNDGDLDWFVSSIWDPNGRAEGNWGVTGNKLYSNHNGSFTDVTARSGVAQGYWGWGACFADFDSDMYLDLFQTSGFDLPVELSARFGHPATYDRLKRSMSEFANTPSMLFMSNRNGSFREAAMESGIKGLASGRGVLCVDFDRDGDIDILVSNHQGAPYLYRNNSKPVNYLNITLISPNTPNLFSVGAKVFVTAGGITQMREVQAGGQYLSGGPPELHFGLGDHAVVSKIKVHWPAPNAGETIFTNVAGNRYLSIEREAL